MAVNSASVTQPLSPPAPRKRRQCINWQENLTGYLYILPTILLVSIFGIFPIGYAFYMSLRRWRVIDKGFIGFTNYNKAIGDWTGALLFVAGFFIFLATYYVREYLLPANEYAVGSRVWVRNGVTVAMILLGCVVVGQGWARIIGAGDDRFLNSLPVTFYYAMGTVPIQIAIALVLASILYQKLYGQELFRMIFFLPYITPVIATALIFRNIFSPRETSLANQFLEGMGGDAQRWLFEQLPVLQIVTGVELSGFFAGPSLALVSIIMFGVWTYIGYNTVIFLAGLGSIPRSLYEAAEIDGANQWHSFRYITIPLLSPVTFYLSLIGFIGTFKAFNHIFVMQEPAAQGTVVTTSLAIYNSAFKASQFGYASAQAMLLFLVILFLTFVQTRVFGNRVFYG
ncbi:MAG: sugar ABC transporter permease [Chloroflexota bacterium]